MKKYLLGLFAIMVALGLSAFGKKESKTVGKAQTPLYWYFIVEEQSQLKIGTPVIDEENLRTKEQVFDFVGCEDVGDLDCARGYSSTQTLGAMASPVFSGEEHILDND